MVRVHSGLPDYADHARPMAGGAKAVLATNSQEARLGVSKHCPARTVTQIVDAIQARAA